MIRVVIEFSDSTGDEDPLSIAGWLGALLSEPEAEVSTLTARSITVELEA